MIYIDRKWLLLISSRLRNFKQKSSKLWNFSCPICGDSRTNPHKARGYIYENNGHLSYKCHNCGQTASFSYLLKFVDPLNHREYVMEKFQERHKAKPEDVLTWTKKQFLNDLGKEKIIEPDEKKLLTSINDLPDNHYAKEYVINRGIPQSRWNELYFTDDFKKYLDETFPKHGKEKLVEKDPRLIMFLTNVHGHLSVVCGRELAAENKLRYIKVKVAGQPEERKVFGIKRLDKSKRFFILEGEIDSMFLDNAVAGGDSSLSQLASTLNSENAVLVYDNESRNREIVNQMQEAIETGFKIVIWPDKIIEKDINDIITKQKIPQKELEEIMDKHTYRGLIAQLAFDKWRKW